MIPMISPDANQSAAYLTAMIRGRNPFFFVRIGDGAVECLLNKHGHTCDGEAYTPQLAVEMIDTIKRLQAGGQRVLWGDWRAAIAGSIPKLVPEWCDLVNVPDQEMTTLDYEALLLMRTSPELLRFYAAVKADPRRKLYIGSVYHDGAPRLLGAEFFPLPMGGVFHSRDLIRCYLKAHQPEVILFGAGMGGLIPIVRYWFEQQQTTCIHLGSALDPLFLNATRSRQLPRAEARDFLKELL